MTHLIDILTAVVLCISIVGGGIRAVGKLTRIADSVDRLSASMEQIGETVSHLNERITKLEVAAVTRATRTRASQNRLTTPSGRTPGTASRG